MGDEILKSDRTMVVRPDPLDENRYYFVFVIGRPRWYRLIFFWRDHVELLISKSPDKPTLPKGFSKSRRIGAVRTDGNGYLLRQKSRTWEMGATIEE